MGGNSGFRQFCLISEYDKEAIAVFATDFLFARYAE